MQKKKFKDLYRQKTVEKTKTKKILIEIMTLQNNCQTLSSNNSFHMEIAFFFLK